MFPISLPLSHPREPCSLLRPSGEGPSHPALFCAVAKPCKNHLARVHRRRAQLLVKSSRGPVDYERDQWQDSSSYDYAPPAESGGGGRRVSGGSGPPPPGGMSDFTKALIAGSFIMGLGAGVYFTSEVNVEPSTVASTQIVDQETPSSAVCMANGYSSMVFDQRIFVSFNP